MKRTSIVILALAVVALLPTIPAQEGETRHIVWLHENPLHVAPERINAAVGEDIVLDVKNFNDMPHDLVVCGDGKDPSSACDDRWGYISLDPQTEGELRFKAEKAGTFEYFCQIPGHKQGGMQGELVVAGAGNEENKNVASPGLAVVLAGLAGAAALAGSRRD